jgi:hypothetical protein
MALASIQKNVCFLWTLEYYWDILFVRMDYWWILKKINIRFHEHVHSNKCDKIEKIYQSYKVLHMLFQKFQS